MGWLTFGLLHYLDDGSYDGYVWGDTNMVIISDHLFSHCPPLDICLLHGRQLHLERGGLGRDFLGFVVGRNILLIILITSLLILFSGILFLFFFNFGLGLILITDLHIFFQILINIFFILDLDPSLFSLLDHLIHEVICLLFFLFLINYLLFIFIIIQVLLRVYIFCIDFFLIRLGQSLTASILILSCFTTFLLLLLLGQRFLQYLCEIFCISVCSYDFDIFPVFILFQNLVRFFFERLPFKVLFGYLLL